MAMEVNQTMELTQAMQTLKWLDEERRKDKATIASLEERLQSQAEQLAQQSAQMQELRTALTGIQGALSKVTEFENMVSNFKTEMVLQLDNRDEAWRKEKAESERLRRVEYESLTVDLNRLEKEIRVLPQYADDLNARRAEGQRLAEAVQRVDIAVADLSKRSDERVKAVTYLEEQRRADNRRIGDLEQDTTALHKQIGSLATKFPLLEETIQKQQPRIDEAMREAKKYEKPIEELRISDFQREQKMKQYLDQGEQVAQELERVRTQTQGFIEQQQLAKRALDRLERFQARLEKRQNEVAEMQRVSEDRIRRQWEEWQEEQEKQRQKREVVIEERWRQQGQTDVEQEKRVDALQLLTSMHTAQLDALWESRRSDAFRALHEIQDEYEAVVSQADAQLSTLRGED
jgi:chromosome segregation ATPase